MLYRLWQVGIRGRAWRVVKDMYRAVRSCVMLKGKQSKWWEFEQGVRQGSVLSPLLFSVTINSVVDYMKSKGHGIDVGGKKISCLLFADDLVVVADTEEGMKRALSDLDTWARQWRFVFNAGKCGVMVHGQKRQPDRKWMLGAAEVQEVECYKYLGMERERKKGWDKFIERTASKARSRLYQLMLVGAHQHGLRPSTGKKLAEGDTEAGDGVRCGSAVAHKAAVGGAGAGDAEGGSPDHGTAAQCAVRCGAGRTRMDYDGGEERCSQTQIFPSTANTAR
jgi:hypothetical protein